LDIIAKDGVGVQELDRIAPATLEAFLRDPGVNEGHSAGAQFA
jgi:hypothetical protein